MKVIIHFTTFLALGVAFVQAQEPRLNSPEKKERYVLQYKNHITLDEALAAVEESGADIERPLSCTRGVIISVDDYARRQLASEEGFTLTPLKETHAIKEMEDGRDLQQNGKKGECQCKGYGTPSGSCELTAEDVLTIKEEFKTRIDNWGNTTEGDEDQVDVVGALIRLAFHDRAAFSKTQKNKGLNGMNGCLNLADPRNFGLDGVFDLVLDLQRWVDDDDNIGKYVSRGDLIALAGIAALEFLYDKRVAADGGAIPPLPSPILPNYTFKCGREDVGLDWTSADEPSPDCLACETTFLPVSEGDAATNIKKFHNVMFGRMKFKPRETVALMGTHAFGRLKEENSGYLSRNWVFNGPSRTLSNAFYNFMFAIPWRKIQRTTASSVTFTEWTFGPFGPNRQNLTYLNTDAILCIDIEDPNCDLFGGGSPTCKNNTQAIGQFAGIKKQYGTACEEFANDEQAYLNALFDAYMTMVDAAPCGNLVVPQ